MNISLSNRLLSVASMVLPDKPVADIGTDHGYLPVYLIINNICPKVIAADRAKGPLESAKQLVQLLSLNRQIDLRLGDGLTILQPQEVDTICIAGMGGMTIIEILENALPVLASTERLVLQPMRGTDKVRRWLAEHGWQIVQEDISYDSGFYYEIMAVEKGEMTLSEDEIEFGPLLMSAKHPLLSEHLNLKIADMQVIVNELAHKNTVDAQERYEQLNSFVMRMQRIVEKLENRAV